MWQPLQFFQGIYADGVYLNAPVAGACDLFDLKRIEVLRTTGNTLRENTTAGAVNYISKKPTFSEKPMAINDRCR